MTASPITYSRPPLAEIPHATTLVRDLPGGPHADRARAVLQDSTAPVLVLPAGETHEWLPGRVVVVLTGEAESHCAVDAAARIASGGRSAVGYLTHPSRSDDHPTLAPVASGLRALRGEPIAAARESSAATVCDACRRYGASLIVVGARAMPGVRCAISLAERVAQDADCAVLLARPTPGRAGLALAAV